MREGTAVAKLLAAVKLYPGCPAGLLAGWAGVRKPIAYQALKKLRDSGRIRGVRVKDSFRYYPM